MDINQISQKVLCFLKKYRYPILVLVVGILLMCLPSGSKQKEATPQQVQSTQPDTGDLAARLEQILSQIKGVGKVKVLLTQAAGEEFRYQYDESGDRKDTVIITDGNREQSPVISQVLPPKYLGAVIVCQGAESPAVRLAVVEAVSRVTGLGADAISVLKMK